MSKEDWIGLSNTEKKIKNLLINYSNFNKYIKVFLIF